MTPDYWIDMVYYVDGRQRRRRMVAPFRSRRRAEAYVAEYLAHRCDIGMVEVVPEEGGFFDSFDRNSHGRKTQDGR